jgi:short-subunit dehydrogenase
MQREVTLITGASSGIGRELTELFAESGFDLVLVARNEAALNELASQLTARHPVSVTVVPKDLSLPQAPEEIYDTLKQASIAVDVLVNNAGTQVYGALQDTDTSEQLRLIQVNLVALTHLTMLFGREMVDRGRGRILNVASTGAFSPTPLNAIYCATKAYVLSFSEAIARDLEGTGVTVTCLCPGATETRFAKRAGIENVRLFQAFVMNAREVARAGYRGLMSSKTTVVPGVYNQILVSLVRFTPRRLVTRIGKYLMSRST